MNGVQLPDGAGALLESAGYGEAIAATPLAGGANNRVYRLDTSAGPVALKAYFAHPDQRWDRLGAEWAFATFAWNAGVRALPQPIAVDAGRGIALYEFVDGAALQAGNVQASDVDAAVAFFTELNARRDRAGALGAAAEACFSVAAHVRAIDARVRALYGGAESGIDAGAATFVRDALLPAWQSIRSKIERAPAVDEELPAPLRCVSPSDFGFHNALRRSDSQLAFLDFEYAGWDDPAKLAGDFFNQVAVPVPPACYGSFIDGIAQALDDRRGVVAERAARLMPAYAIKWCCIVLNEFGAVGSARRRYAGALGPERKAEQLRKARGLLERIAARSL